MANGVSTRRPWGCTGSGWHNEGLTCSVRRAGTVSQQHVRDLQAAWARDNARLNTPIKEGLVRRMESARVRRDQHRRDRAAERKAAPKAAGDEP